VKIIGFGVQKSSQSDPGLMVIFTVGKESMTSIASDGVLGR